MLYFAHSLIVEIKQPNKLNCPLNTGLLEHSRGSLISPNFLFTKSRATCALSPLQEVIILSTEDEKWCISAS